MKFTVTICLTVIAATIALAGDGPEGVPVVLSADVSANSLAPTTQPATAAEPQPGIGRPNPFAPSPRLETLAANGVATSQSDQQFAPAAVSLPAVILPKLEGVMVRDDVVLVSFRLDGAAVVVEPGQTFGPPGGQFMFVSYRNNAATLRDGAGQEFQIRVMSNGTTSRPPVPRVPTPAEQVLD